MNVVTTFEEATQRLEPSLYQGMLQQVGLTELTLEALTSTVDRELVREATQIHLDYWRSRREIFTEDPEFTEICLEYIIRGISEQQDAVRIQASYRVQLRTPKPLPEEFYVIYCHTSADMQVWPYLRELTHSLTSKMGVPRLTMPLLTSPDILDRPKATRPRAPRAKTKKK